MMFDLTITLGNVITIGSVIVGYVAVNKAAQSRTEVLLTQHSQTFDEIKKAFITHELQDAENFRAITLRLFELTGSVQRLIGQVETTRLNDRRGKNVEGV